MTLFSTTTGFLRSLTFRELKVIETRGESTVTINGKNISPNGRFPFVREFRVNGFNRGQMEVYRFYLGENGKLNVICRWPCYEGGWVGFKIKTIVVNGWDSQLIPGEPLTRETETRFKSDTRELLEINGMIWGVIGALSVIAYIGYSLL
jgi:hypothetical protein